MSSSEEILSPRALQALGFLQRGITSPFALRTYFELTQEGIIVNELPLRFLSPSALRLERTTQRYRIYDPDTGNELPRIRLWVDPQGELEYAKNNLRQVYNPLEILLSKTNKTIIDQAQIQQLRAQLKLAVENAWIAPYRKTKPPKEYQIIQVEAKGYEYTRKRARPLIVSTIPSLRALTDSGIAEWYSSLIEEARQKIEKIPFVSGRLNLVIANPSRFRGLVSSTRALLVATYSNRPSIVLDFENLNWYGFVGDNFSFMQENSSAYAVLTILGRVARDKIFLRFSSEALTQEEQAQMVRVHNK